MEPGRERLAEVPVRVDFDYGAAFVYPGMSADVTIYVRG